MTQAEPNRMFIFTTFLSKLQSDTSYTEGLKNIGAVERLLDYFGADYNRSVGNDYETTRDIHNENIELLKSFVLDKADDNQLQTLASICKSNDIDLALDELLG